MLSFQLNWQASLLINSIISNHHQSLSIINLRSLAIMVAYWDKLTRGKPWSWAAASVGGNIVRFCTTGSYATCATRCVTRKQVGKIAVIGFVWVLFVWNCFADIMVGGFFSPLLVLFLIPEMHDWCNFNITWRKGHQDKNGLTVVINCCDKLLW